MNGSTNIVAGLSLAFALASPVGGRGTALPIHPAIDKQADVQTLLRTGNPVPLMTSPDGGMTKRDWIQFRTDECGMLLTIDRGTSTFRRTSLDDGDGDQMDDEDVTNDMDGMDDQDPADLGRTLIGRWLSKHPEIAVIGDGIDRSCDDGPVFDEDLPSEIEALSPQPNSSGQRTMPRPTMLMRKTIVRTTGIPAA